MTPGFQGKAAVVTGAAGGIGRAVCAALVDAGARVAAVDLRRDALEELERELAGGPGALRPFPADVGDARQARAVVDQAAEEFGGLDFLVNGAGVLRPGRADELSAQDWDDTFAVNARGVFLFSTAASRHLVEGGAVVTIASNAAGVPRAGMAAYAASKAAATAFTKSLGLELAGRGVRCNVVAPGSTDTPMLRALWADESGPARSLDGSPPDYRVGIPLRKFATPEDVADSVLFLLSDRAAHITLHDLYVDGGAALGR
ncbi:2,3-dihydro-2,3-dihydroxybenzoate dehydrogenase [Actinosynnema sp.]|uniref:2,3-dihydro-2,3-dihydroxybenzoate dehydrogenase n=1 Tax=Actinosynnema sp. TaxID=1872144 RepID=UPI003F83E2EA